MLMTKKHKDETKETGLVLMLLMCMGYEADFELTDQSNVISVHLLYTGIILNLIVMKGIIWPQ